MLWIFVIDVNIVLDCILDIRLVIIFEMMVFVVMVLNLVCVDVDIGVDGIFICFIILGNDEGVFGFGILCDLKIVI